LNTLVEMEARLSTTSLTRYGSDYLTAAEKKELLTTAENDPELARQLEYFWPLWARDDQLPPPGDWLFWMLRSGRGAGKTRAGSEKVIEWAQQEIGPIALIGQTKADVRDTMIEVGDSSILRRSPPWFMPEYEPSKRRVVWPNGVIAIAYSGDEPDQLRGPQHAKAWVDELAKFKYAERTMDNLEFGLRVGPLPQGIITTTPRSIRVIKDLLADPDCIDVRVSTFANIDNLPPKFVERLRKK
jgi:phage terminase large subunit-like protein